jgi:hypothetical protein
LNTSAKSTAAAALVSKCRVIALQAAPYISDMLIRMPIFESPEIKTMAVTYPERWILYNSDFVLEGREYGSDQREPMEEGEIAGILLHEVFHVIFDHVHRRSGRDPGLWNLAGDAEINYNLVNLSTRIPGVVVRVPAWAVFPSDPRIRMPVNLTAEEYYEALLTVKPTRPEGEEEEEEDDNDEWEWTEAPPPGTDEEEEEDEPQPPPPPPPPPPGDEPKKLIDVPVGARVRINDGPNKGKIGTVTGSKDHPTNPKQKVLTVDLSPPQGAARFMMHMASTATNEVEVLTGSVTILLPGKGPSGGGGGG